jgi:hypothetical protein
MISSVLVLVLIGILKFLGWILWLFMGIFRVFGVVLMGILVGGSFLMRILLGILLRIMVKIFIFIFISLIKSRLIY